MINWIKKEIAPPGIHKKNYGSLFSVIGNVFERVKNDAETAFNAHFPYLCNLEKLRQHGTSLGIPELPHDTEEEYRARVAAASFHLIRAGERSYIEEQLEARFHNQYVLRDEFLRVFVNISGLSDEDRTWVRSLLDSLLNPNIALTIAEWFHYIDTVLMQEQVTIKLTKENRDARSRAYTYDGHLRYDQGKRLLYDGSERYAGLVHYYGSVRQQGTISPYRQESVEYNGHWLYNGDIKYEALVSLYDPLDIPIPDFDQLEEERFAAGTSVHFPAEQVRLSPLYNGLLYYDGHNLDSFIDTAMPIRICHQHRFNGRNCYSGSRYDGQKHYDGATLYYDGRYYNGDTIFEEVI